MRYGLLLASIALSGCGPTPTPVDVCGDEVATTEPSRSSSPPDLRAEPETLEFAQYFEHMLVVELTNHGPGCSRVRAIELWESPNRDSFSLVDPPAELRISPGETSTLRVRHRPQTPEADEGELRIFTNDPKFPDGILRVPLSSN